VIDVTRERVKYTVRQDLLAGKNRDEMVEDLAGIFDNEARRRAIAQTESVVAFSEGCIRAGIAMGATDCRRGIELSFGAKADTAKIEGYRREYLKSITARF
jgi:hypothetical protein